VKKNVLITGASSGIGRATALEMGNRGCRVVGTTRHPDRLPPSYLEDDRITYIAMDVCDSASVYQGVEAAMDRLGRLDVLINNAGISHVGVFEDMTEDDGRRIMETNFFGAVTVTRACLPYLRQSKGLVINIGSLAGIMGIPFQSFYVASKYALEGLTESLRLETAHTGVRFAIVEPGNIKTEITEHRQVTPVKTDVYGALFESTRRLIEQSLEEAEPPVVIARMVHKVISSQRPTVRYPAGKGARMISLLVKLLPWFITEKILNKYYSLPGQTP
jgi:NAD(P)-dependent dehydrogenase (short-subunit alcohol dehydrogenase family)